jgi:hypothetical protein
VQLLTSRTLAGCQHMARCGTAAHSSLPCCFYHVLLSIGLPAKLALQQQLLLLRSTCQACAAGYVGGVWRGVSAVQLAVDCVLLSVSALQHKACQRLVV